MVLPHCGKIPILQSETENSLAGPKMMPRLFVQIEKIAQIFLAAVAASAALRGNSRPKARDLRRLGIRAQDLPARA
jgi:hypothetical protein